jgi:uncharacterized protein (DUF362 family)/Pyruvate/2-oxoacid:ferredoxin oxidoreductase delta subunit
MAFRYHSWRFFNHLLLAFFMHPRVTLAYCPSYTADLENAVTELLKPLGGMSAFVSPGQKVLIKPNMLTNRTPDQAVTTHPELVRAVIRLVKAAGGIPSVGDSPASAVKIDKVMSDTGFVQLCQDEAIPLIRFESGGAEPVQCDGFEFNLAKAVIEADVVINLPKIKTHVLTTLTAAVKNTYGTIPGYQKAMLHKKFTKTADFGKLVHAIHKSVAPALNIADGIIGMEGAGPSGGTPVSLNFLAASTSGQALDLAICQLLNIAPRAVPYLPPNVPTAEADAMAATVDVKLNGQAAQSTSINLPSTFGARMLPRWLGNILEPFVWIRPAIDDSCIKCGRCVKACPTEALSMESGTKPVLTPKACIGCCCCHEVCPANAIEMTQSPLLNFIRKGHLP